MGKKKGVPKQQVNPRLDEATYGRLESLVARSPGESVTGLAGKLLADAVNKAFEEVPKPRPKKSPNEQVVEELTRVLSHYSQRTFAKLEVINRNLHDATYLALLPKAPPEGEPEFSIEDAADAKAWVSDTLKQLPD